MDTKTAAVNSLYIILFSQAASLLATLVTASVPEFRIPALILMVAGGIGGGIVPASGAAEDGSAFPKPADAHCGSA